MKKGKSVKLNLYQPIKSLYGTVDSKNLKSIYINIQSWITPKKKWKIGTLLLEFWGGK